MRWPRHVTSNAKAGPKFSFGLFLSWRFASGERVFAQCISKPFKLGTSRHYPNNLFLWVWLILVCEDASWNVTTQYMLHPRLITTVGTFPHSTHISIHAFTGIHSSLHSRMIACFLLTHPSLRIQSLDASRNTYILCLSCIMMLGVHDVPVCIHGSHTHTQKSDTWNIIFHHNSLTSHNTMMY